MFSVSTTCKDLLPFFFYTNFLVESRHIIQLVYTLNQNFPQTEDPDLLREKGASNYPINLSDVRQTHHLCEFFF